MNSERIHTSLNMLLTTVSVHGALRFAAGHPTSKTAGNLITIPRKDTVYNPRQLLSAAYSG